MRRKRRKRVTWFSGLFIELASLIGLFAIAMPEKGVALAKYWLTQVQDSDLMGESAPSNKTNIAPLTDASVVPPETVTSEVKSSFGTHQARVPETRLPPGVYPRYSAPKIHSSKFFARRWGQWP